MACCREYSESQTRADLGRLHMLNRIACKALNLLQRVKKEGRTSEVMQEINHLLWEDQEVRSWWPEHQKRDAEERDREKAAQDSADEREAILSKLSYEERAKLGLL